MKIVMKVFLCVCVIVLSSVGFMSQRAASSVYGSTAIVNKYMKDKLDIGYLLNFKNNKDIERLFYEVYKTTPKSERPVHKKSVAISKYFKIVNRNIATELIDLYAKIIIKYADIHDLDPFLVAAVLATESTVKNDVQSSKSAVGLMQIHWPTHKSWLLKYPEVNKKEDMYKPEPNIRAGCRLLASYIKRNSGDVRKGLSRYLGTSSSGYNNTVLKRQYAIAKIYRDL